MRTHHWLTTEPCTVYARALHDVAPFAPNLRSRRQGRRAGARRARDRAAGGVAVVDDAAQALGARSAEGPAGAHGEVGVLISAAQSRCPRWAAARSPGPRIRRLRSIPPRSRRTHSALPRARSRTTPRWPPLLGVLARIPALGIGETVYDPGFAQDA